MLLLLSLQAVLSIKMDQSSRKLSSTMMISKKFCRHFTQITAQATYIPIYSRYSNLEQERILTRQEKLAIQTISSNPSLGRDFIPSFT